MGFLEVGGEPGTESGGIAVLDELGEFLVMGKDGHGVSRGLPDRPRGHAALAIPEVVEEIHEEAVAGPKNEAVMEGGVEGDEFRGVAVGQCLTLTFGDRPELGGGFRGFPGVHDALYCVRFHDDARLDDFTGLVLSLIHI